MTRSSLIPDAYRGREQALVKHNLLSSYLEKLVLIIGMAGKKSGRVEIAYVDCFAGPWGDDSEALETTSIAKSLAILEKCREELGARGANVAIRALFVEKNEKSYSRLSKYLAGRKSSRVPAESKKGDFVALRSEIIDWCGKQAFVFFFVDPKGWMEVGAETLKPLLERPRSELLINFQYDFINRAVSMEGMKLQIASLIGEEVDVAGLDSKEREGFLIDCYLKNLKLRMHGDERYPPRAAYVRVLSPDRDRLKYHLVYLTAHPRGIVEFMEKSESVGFTQQLIKATKREEAREVETGTQDMFGAESLISVGDNRVIPDIVDNFWINYLKEGPKTVGVHEFADVLETTNWYPGELQSSLVRLISAGRVENLDAKGKRPKKPLHWDSEERLQLVDGAGN